MSGEPDLPHRKHMRLQGYDYSQAGAYFITICVLNHEPLLGTIRNGAVQLTQAGQIVEEEWLRTPLIRPGVVLDEHIVMPNHVHGIVFITADGSARPPGKDPTGDAHDSGRMLRSPSGTVGSIVRGFKAATTSRVRELRPKDALTLATRVLRPRRAQRCGYEPDSRVHHQ